MHTTLHLHEAWKCFPQSWHEKFSRKIPPLHWRQGEQKLSICFHCSVHYFTYFFYIPCFLWGELFLDVWLFLSLFNDALFMTGLPTILRDPGGLALLITFNLFFFFLSYSLWIPVSFHFLLAVQVEESFYVKVSENCQYQGLASKAF